MRKAPTILVSCGEASGDLHAARLVSELLAKFPGAKILAFGGEKVEAAGATAEDAPTRNPVAVIVLPGDEASPEASQPQLVAPAGAFQLEQAIALRHGTQSGTAVLTKVVDQGPGYEIYEYVPVE